MKKLIVAAAGIFSFLIAFTQNVEENPMQVLQEVLKQKDQIDRQKEKGIAALKSKAQRMTLSTAEQLALNQQIIKAYQKYSTDSAVVYTLKGQELARQISEPGWINRLNIQLAGLYSTQGLYLESKRILDGMSPAQLEEQLLPLFYQTYSNYYSHYGQSNNSSASFQRSEAYRDSVLQVLPAGSVEQEISRAIQLHYAGEDQPAEEIFLRLFEQRDWRDPDYATLAYFLGLIHKDKGDVKGQTYYLSLSAYSDVMNSTKDNASLQALALMYYDLGEIDKAYQFMESAINDALFCSVRYRNMENSSFYPIINASFKEKEDFKKNTLRKYLALISLLSLVLTLGLLYIYRQMKKVSRIRRQLDENNAMLLRLNREMERSNSKLLDSNHIKEEYIAHLFYICSSYIEKIENYRKILFKKASLKQFDAILNDLKSPQLVQKELKELYKNFDMIFLNLYPGFVEEFNALLDPAQRIKPKAGELLTPELRIFALIRLGITDSMKIATFLRYSLRTVYNYRTRVRNRAAQDREELEEKVMLIGSISSSG